MELRRLTRSWFLAVMLGGLGLSGCEEGDRPPDPREIERLRGEALRLRQENDRLERQLGLKQAPTSTAAPEETPTSAPDAAPPPDWVNKGSSFVDDNGVRFGVGMAAGIKNPSLARVTADNRARAELAKLVSTPTEVVAGDGTTRVKVFSATLSGAQIVDHWLEPETGKVYALARYQEPKTKTD